MDVELILEVANKYNIDTNLIAYKLMKTDGLANYDRLVELGHKPNMSWLYGACESGDYTLVHRVMSNKDWCNSMKLNYLDFDIKCLILACRSGNVKLVKLIALDFEIRRFPPTYDVLIAACESGSIEIVETILNLSAKVNNGFLGWFTRLRLTLGCLYASYRSGSVELVKFVEDRCSWLSFGNNHLLQVAEAAYRSGNYTLCLEVAPIIDERVVIQAALSGNPEVLLLALKHYRKEVPNLIFYTCLSGNMDCVKLVNQHYNIDCLEAACYSGNSDLIDDILMYVKPNYKCVRILIGNLMINKALSL